MGIKQTVVGWLELSSNWEDLSLSGYKIDRLKTESLPIKMTKYFPH
jgi:hypothetical protein